MKAQLPSTAARRNVPRAPDPPSWPGMDPARLRRFVDAIQALAGDIAPLQPARVERDLDCLLDFWPDASVRELPLLSQVLIETACQLELLTGSDSQRHSFVQVIWQISHGAPSGSIRDCFAAYASLVRAKFRNRRYNRSGEPRIAAALAYIDAECRNPSLRLDHVSASVRMSKWHLSRLLRQQTGHGFSWHLMQARLSHALDLLGSPPLTIKEIASRVGYSSVTQFDRHFKQVCGMTPRQWRTRHTPIGAEA